MLGDYNTGKTSLAYHFANDTALYQSEPTIGLDFMLKKIVDERYGCIEFFIWDTSGAEKYNIASLTQTYYRNANAAIFVFDVTRKESFDNIGQIWMPRLYSAQSSHSHCRYYLVANKCDLEKQRLVSEQDALEFAGDNNMHYIELSSLHSDYKEIRKPFIHLAVELIDHGVCAPTSIDRPNDAIHLPAYIDNTVPQVSCCSREGHVV
jgi:Ras-related protein Rab-11A